MPIAVALPRLAVVTSLLASLSACRPPAATLSPAQLRTLEAAASADALVYRGAVYPQADPSPAFAYERRVGRAGDDLVSSHVTKRLDDRVIVLQRARHGSDYRLLRFEAIQRQTGVVGDVTIVGNEVELTMRSGARRIARRERVTAPVVVGPTLFGVILQHWEALRRGRSVPIRFAVVEKARTYGFTLRRVAGDPEHTRIELRADRWLVRAAVPPMTITFDSTTRKVVRYEGRVPPLRETDRGLRPLDARVEYEFVARDYR